MSQEGNTLLRVKALEEEVARQNIRLAQLEATVEAASRKSSKSSAQQQSSVLSTKDHRASVPGVVARWTKPVVIAPPGLEELRAKLVKRLGCEAFAEELGPTVSYERFKSNDPNMRFNWARVVGRRIVFLFDTVDQNRLFEQLSLLQALQGFAVPDAEDCNAAWKSYVMAGAYSWGRASHITVVLPWYRPCQMERTSRWHLRDGKWTNGDPEGQWLDVPTAQYMARLLSTPGSVPPLPGPSASLDGMPLSPLWRPPLELLFVELHRCFAMVQAMPNGKDQQVAPADGKWTNGDPEGQWLDVPTAQYMARLLSTPGSVPPLPGPSASLDGMPLSPLWRPPLELLFVELHEELPISHSVSDLGATMRMERFVPYFLERFKAADDYAGPANTFVLFPDRGAFKRDSESVLQKLNLDGDHILYINKSRVGESVSRVEKLFYEKSDREVCEVTSLSSKNHILVIDDFTNSGSSLFGAVNLARKMVEGEGMISFSIYVTHMLAAYDPTTVSGLLRKLHDLGPSCRFYTTNTIPLTTDLLQGESQVQVLDIADFLAALVMQ
eukprot:CAMPEP_0172778448 /NCGR_PEP_ID=MMETSP1074-20121228/201914_1 /TAXON_ID=2916 /ORGANISM="Ceratium fusus, Strain PA161109" /LENGTH=553 /DNA_ID=CAMNT_0013615383 /DNA_START=62 /DNA_END=1724 /DNA_ORIENTATION=+